MADLKLVYKAFNKQAAEDQLLFLEEKWGKKYPAVIDSWNNNWERLSTYFDYAELIHKTSIPQKGGVSPPNTQVHQN